MSHPYSTELNKQFRRASAIHPHQRESRAQFPEAPLPPAMCRGNRFSLEWWRQNSVRCADRRELDVLAMKNSEILMCYRRIWGVDPWCISGTTDRLGDAQPDFALNLLELQLIGHYALGHRAPEVKPITVLVPSSYGLL